jgi:hypothetical protein
MHERAFADGHTKAHSAPIKNHCFGVHMGMSTNGDKWADMGGRVNVRRGMDASECMNAGGVIWSGRGESIKDFDQCQIRIGDNQERAFERVLLANCLSIDP